MGEVVVEFEYEAKEEDELSLNVGDIITEVVKVHDGWCEGLLNGRRGLFPDNFVKEIKKEKTLPTLPPVKKTAAPAVPAAPAAAAAPEPMKTAARSAEIRTKLGNIIANPTPPGGAVVAAKKFNKRAKVTHEYAPQNPDELTLEVGQIIEILKQEEEGWWEGVLNGKVGMFPSNFVEVIDSNELTAASEEFTEIKGRRIQGVGFGNIFGGGPINLRPTAPVPLKKESTPVHADSDKTVRDVPRASVKAKVQTPVAPAAATHSETKSSVRAIVRYPYTAVNEDELNLAEGDIIVVLDQNLPDQGWWRGELKGHVGVFPDNFVELLPNTEPKPQRPPIPIVPVNNGVAQPTAETELARLKRDGHREPPARPPSALIEKPAVPKVAVIAKPQDTRPSIETDDHKAKNQEVYRSGTLDRAVASENPLKPLTADRPKVTAGRRPPNMAARREPSIPELDAKKDEVTAPPPVSRAPVARDEQPPVAAAKKEVFSPLKEKPEIPMLSKTISQSSTDSATGASPSELVHLQQEIARLREEFEQLKRLHDKRLNSLMAELDEEKKTRLNLQVEIDRLKKRLSE